MKKWFLIFLVTLVFFSCKRTPKIEIGQNVYISATVLNARNSPSLEGEKVGKLKLGDIVKVLERSEKEMEIDGKSNYWYHIESSSVNGWVFGGYLSINKVETRDAMITALQGNFAYCAFPDRMDCSNTFEFEGESFVLRVYDHYTGITEKAEGTYEVYADHLVIDAQSRLVRPSVFIQYPQTDEERSAYYNAYHGYSNSDEHLVSLSTYPAEGKKDLYFYVCNEKLILLESKLETEEACKASYAYSKSY